MKKTREINILTLGLAVPLLLTVLLSPWDRVCAEESVTTAEKLPPIESIMDQTDAEDPTSFFPPVESVVREAVKTLPQKLQGGALWLSRSRVSSFMPIVKVGYGVRERNIDRTIVTRDGADRNRLDDYTLSDGVRDFDEHYITASWDLAEIFFDDDELEIAQTERSLAEFRFDIQSKVIDVYFELKSATTRYAALAPFEQKEAEGMKTTIERNTAFLNAFTDGFFSEYIEQAQANTEGMQP